MSTSPVWVILSSYYLACILYLAVQARQLHHAVKRVSLHPLIGICQRIHVVDIVYCSWMLPIGQACSKYFLSLRNLILLIVSIIFVQILVMLFHPAFKAILFKDLDVFSFFVRYVQVSHAHWTSLFDNQPLVYAIIMEVVVTRLQDFDSLMLWNGVKANCAVVYFYLRRVLCHWWSCLLWTVVMMLTEFAMAEAASLS